MNVVLFASVKLFKLCFFTPQRQSLDRAFLRDAVLERLQDDVPEVVAASLKVLEVSLHQGALPLTGQSRVWTTDSYLVLVFLLSSPQVLIDNLDPEDVVSGLLTLLHRQEVSVSESWSVIMLLHYFRNTIQRKGMIARTVNLPPTQAARANRGGAFTVRPVAGNRGAAADSGLAAAAPAGRLLLLPTEPRLQHRPLLHHGPAAAHTELGQR